MSYSIALWLVLPKPLNCMDEKSIQPFVSQLRRALQGINSQTFGARKDNENRIKELDQE